MLDRIITCYTNLIIFSKLIITIFFERGEFNSDNTDIVYLIEQMYFVQIPFYIIGIIMNKYLTAINKNNFFNTIKYNG